VRTLTRILVLAAGLLAVGAPTALAGKFEVKTCIGAGPFDGWSYQASYYVGAYADCSVTSNSGAPAFSAASAIFTAPPGTAVVGIRGQFRANQQGGWQVGVYDFSARAWRFCHPEKPCQTFGAWFDFGADGFHAGQLGILQICGADPCRGSGSFAIRSVALTLEDPSPPTLDVSVPSGWVRGTQAIGYDASDNSGIQSTRLLVDGREGVLSSRTCDNSRAVPCPNGAGNLYLNTSEGLADGAHTVTVQATDAAGNVAGLERPLLIDNTAPGQVRDLIVYGGEGWRSNNEFTLSWETPTQPGVSPIAAVEFESCPVGARRGDNACKRGVRSAADLRSETDGRSVLDDVQVPGEGEWTTSVWLRDEAGNQNPETARTVTLRFDDTPPIAAFRPLDPGDPTRIRIASDDDPSGIAETTVELQRRGESTWRTLATQLEDGGFAASLDDVNLPDGVYALRARAVDRAGNERSTMQFEGGQPAELALPVRIPTQLAVGKPRRTRVAGSKRRYRTALLGRPEVGYGRAVRVQGRLTTPGENPLPGAEVQVFERVQRPDAAPRPIGTVTTSRTGRFSFRIGAGPNRIVSFRYGGTKTIRPDVADVDLRVRSSTSFSVSRSRVVNGQAVRFSGRLRGGNIPAEGKLVALQALSRGRWRPFATTRASARTGRWSYTYRFDGTRGKVRYRFRVRVLREATYPFSTGASGTRRVLVRGI